MKKHEAVKNRMITFAEQLADFRIIPLTKGMETYVDSESYVNLIQRMWQFGCDGYATSRGRDLLHRQVTQAPRGICVDHINCNKLDNRKSNLRFATNAENRLNRGKQSDNKYGYKGVCWHKASSMWVAQIMTQGRVKHLGCFITPEDAHNAYCNAAQQYHREFARFN